MIEPCAAAARRGATNAMRRFLECRRRMSSALPQQQHNPRRPLLAFEEVHCDASGRLAPSSWSATPSAAAAPDGSASHAAAAAENAKRPFTAVFLHGLLGSSRNWRTYCRNLAQACSLEHKRPYRLILADLRAHGRTASAHAAAAAAGASSSSSSSSSSPSAAAFPPPHTLEAAARDVRDLIARHPALAGRGPDALVGLSLGGKVALEVVRQQQRERQRQREEAPGEQEGQQEEGGQEGQGRAPGQGKKIAPASALSPPFPRQVWVLDSQPGLVEREGDGATSVGRVMRLLKTVPQPLPSRQALYDALARERVPLAVAQWLGGALQHQQERGQENERQQQQQQQPQRLVWEFDVPACAELYRSYRAADLWPVMERPPAGVAVHLVRGELSDRWDAPGALERIAEAEARWRREAEAAAAAAAASGSGGGGGGGVGELRVHVLDRATHWLQASNPKGLTKMLVPYFN